MVSKSSVVPRNVFIGYLGSASNTEHPDYFFTNFLDDKQVLQFLRGHYGRASEEFGIYLYVNVPSVWRVNEMPEGYEHDLWPIHKKSAD